MYGEIVHDYSQYVLRKYTNVSVVFDGYSYGPTTKDMTHSRHNQIHKESLFLINSLNLFY